MGYFSGDGLKLEGAVSGDIELKAAPAGAVQDYVLPAAYPTKAGQSLIGTLTGSMSWANRHRVLFDYYADVGNGTTVETDIFSSSIAADTLVDNGDKIVAEYTILTAAHGTATRQIIVYFGGSARFTGTAIATVAAQAWKLTVTVIKTGTTTGRIGVLLNTGATNQSAEVDMTGLDFTAANVLKFTGTAAASGATTNDIIGKIGTVEYKPAAA